MLKLNRFSGNFPRVSADKVTKAWIEARLGEADADSTKPSAPGSLFYGPTREPLIVRPEDGGFEGMGGKLPGKDFTVQDVAKLVGPDRQVDVIGTLHRIRSVPRLTSIDVATQSSSQWTLRQWAEYVRTGTDPNGNKTKVYNIISLEVTGTELAKRVRAPRLVREIDWVDNFWNFPGGKGNVVDEKKTEVNGHSSASANGHPTPTGPQGAEDGEQALLVQNGTEAKPKGKAPNSWPKVQLYCLVSALHLAQLIQDGYEGILDRLARRLCRQLGVLYDTFRIQGVLLYQTDRKEPQGIQ